jgi:hypothetical protein
VIVWLEPAVPPVSEQVPVPPDNVIVQDPPAPLIATVPVGVPTPPETVAVTVVLWPSEIVVGLTLIETDGLALFTVSVVVPVAAA